MEHLRQAVKLLYVILGDMDKISVEGLENQKTFLGCAEGIQTAAQVILKHVQAEEAKEPTVLQERGVTTTEGIMREAENG